MHRFLMYIAVLNIYNELIENNKGERDLEKVINDYESKFFLFRWSHEFVYSDEWAKYEIAKARGNMKKLGIESFELKKESVYGVLDELCRLKKEVKKRKMD